MSGLADEVRSIEHPEGSLANAFSDLAELVQIPDQTLSRYIQSIPMGLLFEILFTAILAFAGPFVILSAIALFLNGGIDLFFMCFVSYFLGVSVLGFQSLFYPGADVTVSDSNDFFTSHNFLSISPTLSSRNNGSASFSYTGGVVLLLYPLYLLERIQKLPVITLVVLASLAEVYYGFHSVLNTLFQIVVSTGVVEMLWKYIFPMYPHFDPVVCISAFSFFLVMSGIVRATIEKKSLF